MPSEVGLRVLVLQNSDAEGGLSQLEVLTKLQKCLEPLPIQRLFDLIVGVGYGGLIAMLLAQGHTVERCKDILKRVFEENPKINIFSGYNADRKMEEILKCHFQDGKPLACQYQEGGAKTAIIGSSGGRNFLIAGYCHPNQKLTGYPREISLKPWEAVAATLLAGKKNPRLAEWVIEEINAIWGKEKKKDLLISIGSNANCRSANQSWMHVAANDLMLFSENFNKKFHLESLSQETAQRVANNLLALCFYLQNNTFQIVLNCRPELGDLASFLWDHNKNFEFQLIQNHVDHMPQNMKFPLDWSRGILTPISIPIPDWRAIKVSLLSKDNWNSFEISGGVLEKPRLHEHPALQPLPLSITPKGTKHTFWKPGK
ncbi:hypothetical protein M433DRAFT_160395 [Acidomyces richmondensis BFW]|nr:hypothetical protein M433DRAFT_160395 [Acidomyces richmondensis BFW]